MYNKHPKISKVHFLGLIDKLSKELIQKKEEIKDDPSLEAEIKRESMEHYQKNQKSNQNKDKRLPHFFAILN